MNIIPEFLVAVIFLDETLVDVLLRKQEIRNAHGRYQHQRLGEGAIGLTLWHWLAIGSKEIYVTVFAKHTALISLLTRFGFEYVGDNLNGEGVYVKDRDNIDFSDPYKAFPFLPSRLDHASYLIVNDYYHDTMFPFSELKNTIQERVDLIVANGLTKIYVGAAANAYQPGDLVFIYRKHTGEGTKRYKSCLTSYCVITDVIRAKMYGRANMPFDDLIARIGNKSVYDRCIVVSFKHRADQFESLCYIL